MALVPTVAGSLNGLRLCDSVKMAEVGITLFFLNFFHKRAYYVPIVSNERLIVA